MNTEKLIEDLKDTFTIGYQEFEPSRAEAELTWDFYHNRQYTAEQLNILKQRGQPAETFNVVKLFTRMLVGYYSTVVNNIQAVPIGPEDVETASLFNDVIAHVLRDNHFFTEGEKVKLDGILSGLMCTYVDVVDTGARDKFGRPINKVVLEAVPSYEIVLDPSSTRDDYEDARYIHRFRWVIEEKLQEFLPARKLKQLTEHYNFTWEADADFEKAFSSTFTGRFRVHNNYLLVHSVIRRGKKVYSVIWHDDIIIEVTDITNKAVPFPYRVMKVHTSHRPEYYGVFHDVLESQKAINQALIKLQLLVNSQKIFVQSGAVENLAAFTNAVNRVTGVIPVQDLTGIKVENLSQEALEQYQVIDRALDRIQRVLGINDSFLGMAYASDSGRKVKLQQNAAVVALRYLTGRIESYYRFLGQDVANLIKQYYTANQVLRIAEQPNSERWVEINKPMEMWSGELDANGEPVMEYVFEEVLTPEGQPQITKTGQLVIAPIPDPATELKYSNIDIDIVTNAYNDEDEKNQLMLETVLAGPTGQLLAQVNPGGFFQAASYSMQSMKTKNSPEIARIFEQTAQMLKQSPEQEQMAVNAAGEATKPSGGEGAQSPMSSELKLPTNTNEGLAK